MMALSGTSRTHLRLSNQTRLSKQQAITKSIIARFVFPRFARDMISDLNVVRHVVAAKKKHAALHCTRPSYIIICVCCHHIFVVLMHINHDHYNMCCHKCTCTFSKSYCFSYRISQALQSKFAKEMLDAIKLIKKFCKFCHAPCI